MSRPDLRLELVDALPGELISEIGAKETGGRGGWLLLAGKEIAGVAAAVDGADGCISLIYVRPAWRGLGYGSEAVSAIAADLQSRGSTRVRALAPAGNGLSVYFWFRQGFRPEQADERGLTLIRELI